MPDRLSESEALIMAAFWQHGAMTSTRLAALVSERGWKPTTLLTFLSRLADKGMLAVQKQGKANLYTPLVTREEYRARESRSFLEDMFGGSAKSFLAAMVEGEALSAGELAELRRWLDEEVAPHD